MFTLSHGLTTRKQGEAIAAMLPKAFGGKRSTYAVTIAGNVAGKNYFAITVADDQKAYLTNNMSSFIHGLVFAANHLGAKL